MEYYTFEKFHNSIATKLRVTFFLDFVSALHNSMTKLCSELFKYKN